MSQAQHFVLPFGINVQTTVDGGAQVSSNLVDQFTLDGQAPDAVAEASADALESFILAMACAGVDLGTPEICSALEVAVDSIGQNMPDESDEEDTELPIDIEEMYVSTTPFDVWPAGVNFVRESDHLEPDGEYQHLPSISMAEFVRYRDHLEAVELPTANTTKQ